MTHRARFAQALPALRGVIPVPRPSDREAVRFGHLSSSPQPLEAPTRRAVVVNGVPGVAVTEVVLDEGSIRISGISRSGDLKGDSGVVVGEARVPSFEQWSERTVERTCPDLQEQVGAAFGPLHLLALGEALADDRIHRGFRQTENVPDSLLAHLSPLGWEHVNLTGDYVWDSARSMSENVDGLRPLRPVPELCARAA